MNILIVGEDQIAYALANETSQLSIVEKIFMLPGSHESALLSKVENLSTALSDNTTLEHIINKENIALCIHDAKNSANFFSALSTLEKSTEKRQSDTKSTDISIPSYHRSVNKQHNKHLSPSSPRQFNYHQSGVDIDAGNAFVESIKPLVKSTYRQETITNLGGFSGAFKIPDYYQTPLLVAATDGVGSKLKFSTLLAQYDNIGIDLVAMCVNDLITCGAEPLFFLDYYATEKLCSETASQVLAGICQGCQTAGCALIGGETAEMPSLYQHGDYDLAGFSVGMVESDEIIDGSDIQAGDIVLGLPSSGIHSNGYSLVRAIIEQQETDLHQMIGDKTLAQWLLTPTNIYVKAILQLKQHLPHGAIKGLAHITGGGLIENIPRVLPEHTMVNIDSTCWQVPEIFSWLQEQGNVETTEMRRVFNMGIGMVVIISPEHLSPSLSQLQPMGGVQIGIVVQREDSPTQCLFRDPCMTN